MLSGNETRGWSDQCDQVLTDVLHEVAPNATDVTIRRYCYNDRTNEVEKAKNGNKLRVRAKCECRFGVIGHIFDFRRTPLQGTDQ